MVASAQNARSAPVSAAPFRSADAAWIWAVGALRAANDRAAPRAVPGPCRPEEILRALDQLYRNRRVELLHARILRIWGLRGIPPNPSRPRERCDWKLWREALDLLEAPLRTRGIVDGPGF